MKLYFTYSFLLIGTIIFSQEKITIYNPQVIQGTLVKTTPPLSEYVEDKYAAHEIVKKENLGEVNRDWPIHPVLNENALPKGEDPVRQIGEISSSVPTKGVTQNFNGIGYTSVNPADPSVDVGPNHVVQMINGSSGAYLKIFDKAGVQLLAQTYFDGITGIAGLGDPVVIYDQLANKWMISEFASAGNVLIIAISQTADPLGSWYIYSFTTPDFPDYPKYSIWPDAYYATTNESDPAVYAFDRTKMLIGDPTATMQRFTLSAFPTIGFQAATPVSLSGTALPPAGSPGLIMRMADDAWSATIPTDRLELYEFDVDFITPVNSNISGPAYLTTAPFDTHLCGYTSFSCINQPGNTNLDPLREVLMNRIFYRNFGSHASLVCSHVTDVTGADFAGVRWYELRKQNSDPWSIYQQGTYSPDNTYNRWMSGIAINGNGDIGLSYNLTNNTLAPSIRYTGRRDCDPLGTLPITETIIVDGGTAGNGSNRYGDYNQLNVDPVDDNSFWFTGMYNPTAQWSTRIAAFNFSSCNPEIHFTTATSSVNEALANIDNECLDYYLLKIPVVIDLAPSDTAFVGLIINSSNSTLGENRDVQLVNDEIFLSAGHLTDTFYIKVFNDGYIENAENINLTLSIDNNGGNAVAAATLQNHIITILDNDVAPSSNLPLVFNLQNFESNTLTPYTTINASGATAFQVGTASSASSQFWTVPATNATKIAFVNDDDCDCNMNDVKLISPVFDLTALDSLLLTYDVYFRSLTSGGKVEDADILISTDGGINYTSIYDIPGATSWTNRSLNLSAYTGPGFNNVKIAFKYSDGTGWLYGLALDNIKLNTTTFTEILSLTNIANPAIQYLAPQSEAYFYHPGNQQLLGKLSNESMHDFGCVSIHVDRAGNAYSNEGTNVGDVAEKTYYISSEHPNEDSALLVKLYFKTSNLSPWLPINNNGCDSLASLQMISSEGNIEGENGNFNKLGGLMTQTFDGLNYHNEAIKNGVDGGYGIADARKNNRAYVNANASGNNDGTSWVNAYQSLDDALSWAQDCGGSNQIRIAKGIYTPVKDSNGNLPADPGNKTFKIDNDVVIVGSFAGNDAANDNVDSTLRDLVINATILSGDLSNNDAANFSNRSDNVYKVVFINAIGAVVIDGLYIKGGNGVDGSALYIESNANFYRLNISDNSSTSSGSAAYIIGSGTQVNFEICTFEQNQFNDLKYGEGANVQFEGVNYLNKN